MEIFLCVAKASKILFFQPWALGNLNTSQLFQGHTELIFSSWILTVNWARNLFFSCLTYAVNWNKNLNFFKLLVAECSSCFNENTMQENYDSDGRSGSQTSSDRGREWTQVLSFLGKCLNTRLQSLGMGPGWVWWRQGRPRHGEQQNFKVSPRKLLPGKWRHLQLCRHGSEMPFFFFPPENSRFSWGVYILCNCCFICCPLWFARWGLGWLREAVLHWRGTAFPQ